MHIPMHLFTLLALCVNHLPTAQAVSWNLLRFTVPTSSKGIIGLSGALIVPPIKKAATYYLWPGLQPADNSGVYQHVLDGRKGYWWIGPGWYTSNTSAQLPWGNGLKAKPGDRVGFSSSANNATTWTSHVVDIRGGKEKGYASNATELAVGKYTFNQAIFAIEIYDTDWDFGPLSFLDVRMIALGNDTSRCAPNKAGDGHTNYHYDDVRIDVVPNNGISKVLDKTMTICSIGNLTMISPK